MPPSKPIGRAALRKRKLAEATDALTALQFGPKQRNEAAAYTLLAQIAWESEVWIAEEPMHMIHFNGERFLGPYPDVMPGRE